MNIVKQTIRYLLWPTLFIAVSSTHAEITTEEKSWRFQVFLDEKEMGYHTFSLSKEANQQIIKISADFEYKVLFFKAFGYKHENTEVWKDGCLQSIQSATDSNGKDFWVEGEQMSDHFFVKRKLPKQAVETEKLATCVMSFAYWKPELLTQKKLLNSQDGDYLDVMIQALGQERITVKGQPVDANRYQIKNKENDLQIDLWYSDNGDWLRLESLVPERDAKLIYQLN